MRVAFRPTGRAGICHTIQLTMTSSYHYGGMVLSYLIGSWNLQKRSMILLCTTNSIICTCTYSKRIAKAMPEGSRRPSIIVLLVGQLRTSTYHPGF